MPETKQVWLRATYYEPGKSAVTTVMSKDDLKEDIHVVANGTREKFGRRTDVEIFEWENDLVSATVEGRRRAEVRIPDREHFKNTLHDFLIASFFKYPATTTIAPGSPAPVSTEDIRAVFGSVRQHPQYGNRSVRVISQDGGTVWLTAGDITVR